MTRFGYLPALAVAAVLLATPGASAAQECVVPDLLVVLDTSGSMREAGGDGRTKWDSAVDALTRITGVYDTSIRWGLMLFPSDAQCGGGYVAVPLPSSGQQVANAILRTGPNGGTPIADSLGTARSHLAGVGDGRPHHVLLVTDGQPNCNGNLDWSSCQCTCTGLDPRCTCNQYPYNCLDDNRSVNAVSALAAEGVSTFVVGFGAGVNPPVLDRMAEAGGTARQGANHSYYEASDSNSLAAALDAIAAQLVTRPCAGPCGPGVEMCTEAGWTACTAPQVGQSEACGDGAMGACGGGDRVCTESGWTECSAPNPGDTRPCPTACGDGTHTCQPDGTWSFCEVPGANTVRDCVGDCGPGTQVCGENGWGTCFGESGMNACGGCGAPPPELCNGVDDDCDGQVDEDLEPTACGAELGCSEGDCRQPCFESGCPSGQVCNSELYCVPGGCAEGCGELTCTGGSCTDPCQGVQCPPGRVCQAGACVEDSCFALGCARGEACIEGSCLGDPCDTVFCEAGQFCRNGSCIGSCSGVACGAGERCRDGVCQADGCASVACAAGQTCSGGSCIEDPCFEFWCPAGRVCSRGACVNDPCLNVTCSAGEVCAYGTCYREGEVPPPPDPEGPVGGGGPSEIPAAHGGGCGCTTGAGATSGLALLAALAMLARRRRT